MFLNPSFRAMRAGPEKMLECSVYAVIPNKMLVATFSHEQNKSHFNVG